MPRQNCQGKKNIHAFYKTQKSGIFDLVHCLDIGSMNGLTNEIAN